MLVFTATKGTPMTTTYRDLDQLASLLTRALGGRRQSWLSRRTARYGPRISPSGISDWLNATGRVPSREKLLQVTRALEEEPADAAWLFAACLLYAGHLDGLPDPVITLVLAGVRRYLVGGEGVEAEALEALAEAEARAARLRQLVNEADESLSAYADWLTGRPHPADPEANDG